MSEVGQVLKNARDTIASGKWTKGNSEIRTWKGSVYCALGAIYYGQPASLCPKSDAYWLLEEAANFLDRIAKSHSPRSVCSEPRPTAAYNDHPDTTLQDVVNLFDKALAELGEL